MTKMTTREMATARYGHIDFATKYWPAQENWIKILPVPFGMFPNWHVLDTTMHVKAIACNTDMHQPLLNALLAIRKAGLGHLLVTFDGCFNIRMVRGSNDHFSAHSYGLAIDINADQNPLGATSGGFYDHPDLVKCFTDQGFDWGGNFTHRKDPMHFSFCWE